VHVGQYFQKLQDYLSNPQDALRAPGA
jgi:hypothetical protein